MVRTPIVTLVAIANPGKYLSGDGDFRNLLGRLNLLRPVRNHLHAIMDDQLITHRQASFPDMESKAPNRDTNSCPDAVSIYLR